MCRTRSDGAFAPVPTNPSYVALNCIFPANEVGKKRMNINPHQQGRSVLGWESDLREFMECMYSLCCHIMYCLSAMLSMLSMLALSCSTS